MDSVIGRPPGVSEFPIRQGAEDATAATRQMIWVPGGEFLMGSDHHYPEEAPAHRVPVRGFWMDRQTVTNREFSRFVEATGHVTVAEQAPDPADYPGARPELLVPASTVFRSPLQPVDLNNPYNWWTYVPGADWRHPQGPQSTLADLLDHPVVQVSWADVEAYAAWAGKTLPTEAEWEFAARGGLDGATYAWGEELNPSGQWLANTWQGDFPYVNSGLDGYTGTAPVGSFPANGYGFSDLIGNVWEWTADWYAAHSQTVKSKESHACCGVSTPHGGTQQSSTDPLDPVQVPRKVMKGGSHLCAPNYCQRYRPAARMPQAVDTATSHLGFRCIIRPEQGATQ